jgi:hypothetical protein
VNPSCTYLAPHIQPGIANAAGQPCGLRFAEAIHVTSLNRALRIGLISWKKPYAPHDPAKVLLDLATIVILGGGALTGLDSIRDEPVIYGQVGSNPTVV